MPWTTPKTWLAGSPLLAGELNTHLRDNLAALKEPPTDLYNVDEASEYSTSSTTFVDVDATDLSLTIATTGGRVLVTFVGTLASSAACTVYFDVVVDGVTHAGNDGLCAEYLDRPTSNPPGRHVSFAFWTAPLSAGSHQFKLAWKVSSNAATLYAGTGAGAADLHPQFTAREVS